MTDKHGRESFPKELALLRDAMRDQQAPDRVEAELRRRFREREELRRPRRAWWRPWAVAAAVATVLLAVILLRPEPEAPSPVEVASEELVTDYMPIGYGSLVSADEFAQIIRVSVPRSDMVRFGLPVRLDAGPERITADVVLGEDGVARAIRFVQ
jgi:hypothetical protein